MKKFRWSWSALHSYDQCPRQYFLGRIAKIKTEQAPQLLAGVKFHDFAESYNKWLMKNKNNINEKNIKKWLDKCETKEEKNFILYELVRYKNLVKSDQTKYYIPIGAEDWLEEDFFGHPFRGKQDYLGLTPNGKYYIMDYKTTMPWRDKDLKKLEHQLILYSVLVGQKLDIDIRHIAGYFYKEKNDNDTKKTFFKKYHGATLTALKRYVNKTINNILNDNEFKPKIQQNCNGCNFKDICFGLTKDIEKIRKNNVEILEDYNKNKQQYYNGLDIDE